MWGTHIEMARIGLWALERPLTLLADYWGDLEDKARCRADHGFLGSTKGAVCMRQQEVKGKLLDKVTG